jgi:hypothetical protein
MWRNVENTMKNNNLGTHDVSYLDKFLIGGTYLKRIRIIIVAFLSQFLYTAIEAYESCPDVIFCFWEYEWF